MNNLRYWRVDVIHENGYHAPSIFVTTEDERRWKAEASAMAQAKESTRLSKYPQWSLVPVLLDKVLHNGKWIDPEVFSKKTGLVHTDGRWTRP